MSVHPWVKSYPSQVRQNAPIELSSVQSVLETAAERFGPRPALDFMNKRTTYAELDALANRAAAGFQKLGVGPGVHVGLFLPNTPHYVIAFFGVLKAGGVVVNYSPLDALPTLQLKIEDSETDILVTSRRRLALSASGEAARLDAAQNADRRRIRRDDARARAGQSADDGCRHAGRRQARRAPYRLPRSHRQRRPLSDPPARRAHRRTGRHPIYRRHHGLAQRRDADARQSHRSLLALHRSDDARRRGPARRRRADLVHPAALPHLFAHRRHAARLQVRRGARPSSALRSRGGGQGHRRKEDHRLHGRADDACRAFSACPVVEKMDFSSLRLCGSGGAPLPVAVQERFEQHYRLPD